MTPTHPPHFQINISTEFVTAFAFSSIADYFFRPNHWLHSLFPLLRIIFPPKSLTAFTFSSIADYFPSPSSTVYACCQLTGRRNPVYGQEYSWGLRNEMQASFHHQAHCLSASEFGRLADNRRLHRIANATVFHVYTRKFPAVNDANTSTPISRLIFPPNLWLHSLFPLLQIIFSAKSLTAFTFFLYCRLFFPPNLWLHSHLSSVADYFFRQNHWLHSHFPLLRIIFRRPLPPFMLAVSLQAGEIPCMDRNTRETCVMRCRLVSAIKPTV